MPTTVSGLDVLVVIILGVSIYKGYRKGLLRSIFGLVSFFLALALANAFSGVVGAYLRQTPLFGWLQTAIAETLGLGALLSAGVEGVIAQADVIAGLPLPGHILALLHANNNPEVFNILGITHIEDYITGFIASMIINTLSAVLVFLLVLITLRMISKSLRIFNHIPIIGGINRMAGAICGAAIGAITIWLIFAAVSLLEIGGLPGDAIIAGFFYENNPVLNFFINILVLGG
ncbi:MAG: CvpA family protein [Defluviitaleaceae bacterium]|nr:CvpA family protein [Defluviitaleaceae bacterium]